ncbi:MULTISPECIES: acyl-homoserine-lactone synthase [Enterobacter]|uniref:Acyl-homoserine-lactone synthase n=1 Tax=Enterobacter vonholyi TaxID=2797505 RepID=A0ABU6DYE2_9ENTR|nr:MULTISPECIES: acyl-homoserine-lactone synthase [Enterobacter]MCK7258285.1 GNAT family N-acetyltransferase [Enterobacter asburiae]AZV05714.1 GNAT family N-acetyltransferase [Enterobacter sp. N18-03635]MCL5633903.1 GNAT family N-acetyltransferase [Enterobacter vonholyi]MDO2448917.1 acyl-homoserine-lactone synthase [Enterobacter vonholyi]MEB6408969.1 GNAT family N-acetyltransferase [Enterobacter vonholyi]
MNSVIEFFLHDYDDLPPALARELYRLRRKTFRDRLDWKVECVEGMEKDQFDSHNTTYLLGMYDGQLLCGARFINATQPTMISEIFHNYFDNPIVFPADVPCCEVSRLFLDKETRDSASLQGVPASKALFLAMIIYCIKNKYHGMYAVASRGMYAIFRHANWKVEVIQRGVSEKGEVIYYIYMPASIGIIEDIISKDKSSHWLREMLEHLHHL